MVDLYPERPAFRQVSGNLFQLAEPCHYEGVFMPEDFTWNGWSVPRPFWVFWPPSFLIYASLVHDFLLKAGVDRHLAHSALLRVGLQYSETKYQRTWCYVAYALLTVFKR